MSNKVNISSKIAPLVLAAALAAGGAGVFFTRLVQANEQEQKSKVEVKVDPAPLQREGKIIVSFAPVVKKVAPSVVNVFTTVRSKKVSLPQMPNDPFFHWFFGERPGADNQLRSPKQTGLGSGVIVTEDGYILTNNHVVDEADEVKVALNDGREFPAKVVGKDPKTDVAVLKVQADGLPFLTMGDSSKIEIGDLVLAIGNPFGIGQTVTMGMVSATGRGNMGFDYEDFIQTDAAINPGNSGGALVDAEGRLIGINTAILSRSGGNQGIGFAVPVNLANYVMTSLVDKGRVIRGFLGVMIQDLTPALAKAFKLSQTEGVLVSEVTPDGAADNAGVKAGDVVLELNGQPMQDSRHLKLAVAQTPPGQEITLRIRREGEVKELKVKVKELPSDALAQSKSEPAGDTERLVGVQVADVDRDARRQLDLPERIQGALVTAVEPASAAYAAGLRDGDVILEINRKKVKDAEAAVEMTRNMKDPTILLHVWSKGGSRYLVVDEQKTG